MRGGVVPAGNCLSWVCEISCNLRNALLNIRSRLQKDLDDSNPIQRLRFDVLDVVDGSGKRSLCDADDAVAHVFRNETVIVPDDADNGNIDIRENSVGVRTIASTPMITMSMDTTTNV